MICGELDQLTPAAFQTELCDCLVDYYEKVCLIVSAGGTLSIKTHKRKFKAPATTSEVVDEGVEEAAGAGAGDIEAAATSMSQSLVRARATPAPAPAAEDDGRASTPPAKAAKKKFFKSLLFLNLMSGQSLSDPEPPPPCPIVRYPLTRKSGHRCV
jgi:hypothetical protein